MAKKNNSIYVTADHLEPIHPATENQATAFKHWDDGYNLVLAGSAGTGKTFLGVYFALNEMLNNDGKYRKIMIIRSLVSTRDPGHLPGSLDEKIAPYQQPYRPIVNEIFGYDGAYNKLISTKRLDFESTSYIRGATFDNMIIVVDEMQNLNFHELDSVITRIGKDCKIIFCGDHKQTDFKYKDEKDGLIQFLSIIEQMRFFRIVEFDWADIVRSDLVRDYIITKEIVGY